MKRSEQYRYADMAALADVLAQVSSSDLSAADLAKLKTELAKPAYGGKTAAERVKILMSPVLVDNPYPVSYLHKTCTCLEMLTFLYPLIGAAGNSAIWAQTVADLQKRPLAIIRWDDPDFVQLRTVATTQGDVMYLCPVSLLEIPSEENNHIAIMEKYPDPSWSAKIWQTPIEAVLGDLSVVTAGDCVKAAL